VKVGLFCTTPGVAVARSMNSIKKTMEMLLTGDAISASEAMTYGLVNRVVKDKEQLESETLKLAEKIISSPPNIIALGKKAFYEQIALPTSQAYRLCLNLL
jgi:enoyl-CoA hydratase/carnithine racemase